MYIHNALHVHDFMKWSEHVHTCLYHVQTRMYCFANSCPGGQDSRCVYVDVLHIPAYGTSIGGAFYGSISRLILLGVKRRGPIARFGLKLD